MKRNDGGPAFAGGQRWRQTDISGGVTDYSKAPLNPGMSLRDWFAGQALAGLAPDQEIPVRVIAAIAYELADAMLAVRTKETPTPTAPQGAEGAEP